MLDVYKSFYKFNSEPFRLSPDHRFSYVHSSYANAKAYLEYAISQGEGFIAITGEPGAGKTTLISGLLAELDKTRINVAALKNLQLDPDNLIGMVVNEFGLRIENKNKSRLLLDLEQFLKKQFLGNQRAVLIIDEAQGLSPDSIEELRLLSNLQYDNCLLLQVFLVGQENLMEMIRSPDMEHLRQRLIASSHLDRLGLEETVAYIEHRLCYAGWRGDPAINEDVLRLIQKFSMGVPRRINLICHRLFLYGGLNRKHTLVGADIQHVVAELESECVLAPDVPDTEFEVDSTPDLSLPRASSYPHIEEQSQIPPSLELEPLIVHTPLQSQSAPPKQETPTDHFPIRENGLEQSGTNISNPSVPGESEKAPRWRQYRWGVVVLGLLAGLLVVNGVETGIKYHQSNIMSAALIEDGSQKPALVISDTALTDDLTVSANNLDQNISEIDNSGVSKHYSSSVPDSSSVPVTETGKKNHPLNFASAALIEDGSKKSAIATSDTALIDGLTASAHSSLNRSVTEIDTSGAIKRYSSSVTVASNIGTNKRPPQEVERKSAELNSDGLEPADDQVVMTAARIEAEHRRLRNEAEQRLNRNLKEGELAGLATAN